MRSPFIFLSVMTLMFLSMGKPLYASACATMAILSVIVISVKTAPTSKAKKIKMVNKDFEVSVFELSKPMTYIRSLFPTANDAQRLQLYEDGFVRILSKSVKKEFGAKAAVADHFIVKTYLSFTQKDTLILAVNPKTEYANSMLIDIVNGLAKSEKKNLWIEDVED